MSDYSDLIAKLRVYPIAGKRPPIHAALRNEAAEALEAQAAELESWNEYCHADDYDALAARLAEAVAALQAFSDYLGPLEYNRILALGITVSADEVQK